MAQIPQRRSTSDTPVTPAGAPGKAPRYGVKTKRGMAGRLEGLRRPGRRATSARASRQAAGHEQRGAAGSGAGASGRAAADRAGKAAPKEN